MINIKHNSNEIVIGITALWLGVFHLITSYGNPFEIKVPIFNTIGILLFLIFVPLFFVKKMRAFEKVKLHLIAIIGVSLIVVYTPSNLTEIVALSLAIFGFLFFLINLMLFISKSVKDTFTVVILSILYFLMIIYGANEVIGLRSVNHIFDLMRGACPDPVFHTALVSMIKSYDAVSIGVDGLNPFVYHSFVHECFVFISNFLNVHPYFIIHGLGLTILSTLILYASLMLIDSIREKFNPEENCFIAKYSHHLIIIVGFSFYYFTTFSIFGWFMLNITDSQMLGMLFIIYAALFIKKSKLFNNGFDRIKIFYLLVSIVLFYFSTLSKVSIGMIYSCAMLYLGIRYWERMNSYKVLYIGLIVLIAFFEYSSTSKSTNDIYSISLSTFFTGWNYYVESIDQWPMLIISMMFFSLGYSFFRIKIVLTESTVSVINLIKNRKIVDVELLLLINLFGLLVTIPFSGLIIKTSMYFLGTGRYISLLCFAAIFSVWLLRNKFFNYKKLNHLYLLIFIICISSSSILSLMYKFKDVVSFNLQTLGADYAIPLGQDANGKKPEMRVMLRSGNFRDFFDSIQKNKNVTLERWYSGDLLVIKTLFEIEESIPLAQKKYTMMWIPQSNHYFWNNQSPSFTVPMIASGISGLVLIDGLPTSNKKAFFGYLAQPRLETPPELRLSRDEVLLKAKEMGFKQLVVLKDAMNWEIVAL